MEKSTRKYYSQYGEDFLLWKLFGDKRAGFYVDVGAFDGVYLSNTFSFEQQGWSGICIEPHPEYFQLCKQARPKAICLNVACVAADNVCPVEFYAEKLGLFSGVRGDREEDVRFRYQKRGAKFAGFDRITVPTLTLDTILNSHLPPGTEIDFISIDVEGTELEVLHGLDLPKFKPRIVVVEANTGEVEESLDSHLMGFGYARAGRLAINTFYTRHHEDAIKLQSISIDCRIAKCLHPLGEEYTLPNEGGLIQGRKVIQESRSKKKTMGKRILNRLLTPFRG